MNKLFTRLLSLVILIVAGSSSEALAQASTVNYGFATNTTGNLAQDANGNTISVAGGTNRIPANLTDKVSPVLNIGFAFNFMGTAYTQFSVVDNGMFYLGATAGSAFSYIASGGTTATPKFAPFASNSQTAFVNDGGGVSTQVVGSAPNRCFVAQWITYSNNGNTTSPDTFQARLYETTGVIEYVYGSMPVGAAAYASGYQVGFSTTSNQANVDITSNTVGYTTTYPTFTGTANTNVTNLHSANPTQRRRYTFTPPQTGTPAAPTTATFSGIGANGLTLNWVDNSTNEYSFAVTRATDANFTQDVTSTTVASTTTSATGGAYTWVQTGLVSGVTYYYRVQAIVESVGAGLTGNQATTGTTATYYWVGAASGTATAQAISLSTNWNTAANGTGSARTAAATNDILIVDGAGTTAGGSVAMIVDAAYTIGQLKVTSGTTLSLAANNSTAKTITISGGSGDDLSVPSGCTLTMNDAANAVNIIFLSSANDNTGTIAGTLNLGGATGNTFNSTGGTRTIVTVTGTINGDQLVSGSTYISSARVTGSVATLFINNGAIFNVQNIATSTPQVPLATWGASSTLNLSGNTTNTNGITNGAQLFGNVTYNSPNSTVTFNMFATNSATIQGDLTITHAGTNSAAIFRVSSSGGISVFGNVTLTAGGNTTTGALQGPATGFLNIFGNLVLPSSSSFSVNGGTVFTYGNTTIPSSTTFLITSGTYNQRGSTFTNNGILTGLSTAGTLAFTPLLVTTTQTLTGTGTQSAPLNTLTVNNGGLTLNQSAQLQVAATANFRTGAVTNSGKLTIGVGGTTNITVNMAGNSATTTGGSLDAAPTFSIGTGTAPYTLTYGIESGARTTSFEIPSSRSVTAITTSNITGLTIAGTALTTGTFQFAAGAGPVTTSNLLTVTGTVAGTSTPGTGSISGYSSTAYVKGPLAITLPASLTGATAYTLPVGKSTYNAFVLTTPVTSGAGTVTVRAESFDAGSGGSFNSTLSSISSTRYWAASITSGSGNFTSSLIRLTDTRGVNDAIGVSATQTGTYAMIGGSNPTLTSADITSTTPAVTSIGNFYTMGERNTSALSNLAISPTGFNCTSNVTRTVTVTVTPGAAAVNSVTLSYQVNGGSTTNVAMTNTSGNDWSGTIPTVSPSNGVVTWTVTAVDANSVSRSVTGTSYQDVPNLGITLVATAGRTSVCVGDTTSLSVAVGGPAPTGYCTPTTTGATTYNITNFTTTGAATNINNSSSGTTNYENFSSTVIGRAIAGSTIGYSISCVTPTSSFGRAIWIDLNADGDFADAGEQVASSTSYIVQPLTGTFTIPAGTSAGTKRMRIQASFTPSNPSDPCTGSGSGQYEDYTLVVGPAITAYSWSDGATTLSTTNPYIATVSATTTYTGTATMNACPVSASVTITGNPIPTTPSGTNSSQCGAGIPTAHVTSTSGFASPTFKWYTVATGGTAIAGESAAALTATTTTSTTTYYVSEATAAGCESPRRAVTVTVTPPPTLTLNQTRQTVCIGSTAFAMSVTSNTSDFDSYLWTPATGLFTDAAATVPYTLGTNATTVYVNPTTAGTTVYTLTTDNSVTTCGSLLRDTIVVPQNYSVAVSSARSSVCTGDTTNLSLTVTGVPGATAPSGYCTPTTTGATTYNIVNFTTIGASTNILSNTTGTANYEDFSGTVSAIAPAGTTINYTISCVPTTSSFGRAIWIDLNADGDFADAGEQVASSTAYVVSPLTGTFTIPAGTTPGAKRMRIQASFTPANPSDPCTATGSGQFEDYTMIVAPVPASYAWSNGVTTVGTTNPYAATVSATTTFTGSAFVGGCANSATVNVTALPVPTTPTATNSGHCGAQTPTASVASTSGFSSPTFRWYTVATGGTAISGQTGTTLSNYPVSTTTTFYVSERTAVGCESPRVAVTITVTTPPALTINGTKTSVCNGGTATLNVTSNTSDYDSYVWTPVTNLFTDAAATTPYTVGGSFTTVYAKPAASGTVIYTLTANNSISGCQSILRDTVTGLPVVAVTATPLQDCQSAVPTATLTNGSSFTGTGATIAWQTSPDSATYTTVTGQTGTTYTVGAAITSTTYFRAVITDNTGSTCASPGVKVTVFTPTVTSTTPVSRCGPGTVTLGATANAGSTLSWYADAAGGLPIATGTSFTTPTIFSTTNYYVSATQGGSSANVGMPAYVGTDGTNTGGYLIFSAIQPFTLLTTDIYPGGTGAGTMTVQLANSSGTVLQSAVVNLTGSSTPVAQTVSLNFAVPVGTDYRLVYGSVTGGVTGAYRNYGANASFPYTLPGVVSITNGSLAGYYYFFYNWRVTTGCESARTTVAATVTPAPALTLDNTNVNVCGQNAIGTMSVSAATVGNFSTYQWSPTTNLYTDAAATVPYTIASNASTVYVKSPNAGTTIYTLNALDVSNCAQVLYDTVNVRASYATSVVPNAANVCVGSQDTLTFNFGNAVLPSGYCTPSANTNAIYFIDTVITTGGSTNISNTGTGLSAGGYGDFTSRVVAQEAGSSVSVRVGNPTYTMGRAIWVDWNQDGIYDASEKVFTSNAYVTGVTATFSVPTTALAGRTRMRIISDASSNNPSDPCALVSGLGETEEYTFLVGPTASAISWSDGTTTVGTSNPLIVTANTTTTYTATAMANGCSYGANITRIANPVPTTPTATNGSHCGTQTPVASVASTSGLSGSTFKWYLAATGGTAIANQTGSTLSGYPISATTTFYVSELSAAGCEGPRVAVIETVTTAPTLTIDNTTLSVCNGDIGSVSVTSTLGNYNSYVWSPTTGLFADAAATVPYTQGTNASTVYISNATAGTTTYTLTATNSATSCASTAASIVTIQPAYTALVSAGRTTVCAGDTTRLALLLTGASGGSVPGGYCTPTTTGATTYNIVSFSTTGGQVNISNTSTATSNYEDFSSTAAAVAAPGTTVNYSISCVPTTSSFGRAIWIDFNLDGDFADAGEQVASSTSYVVSPITGSFLIPAGTAAGTYRMRIQASFTPANPSDPCAGTGAGQYEDYAFNVGPTPTSVAWSNGVTTVGTGNPYSATVASTTTFTGTASLNGCQYSANVSVTANPVPTQPTANNSTQCGTQTPTASVTSTSGFASPTFKWYTTGTGGTAISGQTGSSLSSYPVSATTTFYVTEVSAAGCESSPRRAVTVTVSAAPTLATTSGGTSIKICNGGIGTLSVSAATVGNFTSYTWSPATNLYTDAAATTPYTAGTNASTVYVMGTTAGTTTYTVTGTGSGCQNTATASAQILPVVAVTLSSYSICTSGTPVATLTSGSTFTTAGGTIAWATSPDSTTFTTVSGATGVTYTPGTAITATTFYRATVTLAGNTCGVAARGANVYSPTVTGSTPATRCGAGTLTLQATGSAGSTVNWFAAATGGTALGTGTSFTTPVISATTTYYASAVQGTCSSSPRNAVVATVTTSSAIAVDRRKVVVCNNDTAALSVSAATAVNYTTFNWTPVTGLFTDAAATTPYNLGDNASTVYVKNATAGQTVYTVTASDASNCSAITNDTAVVLPTVAVTVSPTNTCLTGTPTATLTNGSTYTSNGATITWATSPDSVTFTPVSGATGVTYTPGTAITSNTFYQATVTNAGRACGSAAAQAAVNNPTVTSTTPATRCGPGTVTLNATGSAGTTLNWYTAATGGLPTATGTSFTTPSISATTTYYVAAASGSSFYNVGKTGYTGTDGTNTSGAYLIFNALAPFNLQTVDIYPGGTGAGTMTIQLQNSTGTVLQTATVNLTGSATPVAQTATVNFAIPVGTAYRLVYSANSGGVTGAYRNYTAGTTNFPYTVSNVVSITDGSLAGYYYYFYNWGISTGCEGPRTAVAATVTTPAALAVTSNKVSACNNVAEALSVSSGTVGNFTTYDWSPTTNLFTDAAATTPYTTGTNASTVYVKRSTAGQIVYTVTGTDASNCTNTATDTVTVLPALAVTVTPSAICGGTGTPTATLTSGSTYTAAGATIAWATSPDSVTFTPVSGATGVTYTPGSAITSSTFFQATVTNATGTVCGSPAAQTTIANPTVTGTTAGTRCGTGTVVLGATGSAGTTLNWYATSTGGAVLGSGTSFTTPSIAATTNYFVSASLASGSFTSSRTAPGTSTGGSTANQGLVFSATTPFTLNSVDVYNSAATSGTMTIQLQNSAGTTLQTSSSFTVPGSASNPYRANLNWSVPVGTGYRLLMSAGTALIAREASVGGFPYTIGSVGNITAGYNAGNNSTYYNFYNWKVSTTCEGSRTQVTATVNSSPAVTVTQASQPACINAIATLSVSAATVGNYPTYTWTPTANLYTDAAATTPYTTGTNASTVYAKRSSAGTNNYVVAASGGNPGCATSATATVITVPAAVVTVSPASLCGTGTPTATLVSGSTYTNAGATIAWAESPDSLTFTPVSGATGITYTPASAITANTYYQATVTANGNVCGSGARQVVIIPAVVITSQPVATTVCAGQTLTLSVVATNATGYQWKLNGTNISGATSATYTVATAAAGNAGNYSVVVSGTAPCTSVTSSTVAVTVNPAVAITTQPVNRTICEGNTLTLSVSASNAAGYQWYQDGNAITGATSATYTVNASAITDSGSYYVSVGGTAPCTSLSSSTVHVTINPGVVITTQPAATTVCAGQTLNLSVTASNATGYQWKLNGTNITGATSATYTVATAAAGNAGNYTVVVSGTAPCTSTTSSTVAVVVNPAVAITTQPVAQTVCSGSGLTLSVTASNAAGYQWYQDGNAISGATSATYTVATASASDAGNYYVSVGGTAPCTSLSSDTVAVIINAVPAITASATSGTVCSGGLDTLNVSSSGSNYTYVWNTPTPTTGAQAYANPTATRYYRVTATDGVTGCIIKDSVQVSVEQYPTVTFTPSAASIGCGGAPVQLTATVNTTGTVTKAVWKPAGYVTGVPLVGLFTDAAGTVAYDSTTQAITTAVYAKYSTDIAYNLAVTTALCPATTSSNSVELSVNAASGNGLAAGSPGANLTYYTQSGSDTIQNSSCQTIASVAPTGASPVSGLVMTTVYSSAPGAPAPVIASGRPYVPRYYQITPENNAATSTGTITLYATNDEFKQYNTVAQDSNNRIVFTDSVDYNNVRLYLLPDQDSPSTIAERSSTVLISKESGTSATGLPGSFSPGVKKAIRPSLVAWNATDSRWEITFSTTGFSGFFIGGGGSGAGPLPVTFTGITATAEKGKNRVDWNVGSENNVARYEVEKLSGTTYETIGSMPAVGMASYTYYDVTPSKGLNTYRVKAVDVDGGYSYSPSAVVRVADGNGFVLDLYPNPTSGKVTVKGTGSTSKEATVTVSELSGRVILTQIVKAAGDQVDISSLPSGTYMLQWSDGMNKESIRVTKQ